MKKQASAVSLETLQRLFDLLVENEDLVIRSGNPRLVLEMTLLKMAYAAPVTPLDELIQAISDLKHGAPQGGPAEPVPEIKENCPECGNPTVIHKDGCDFCTACGYVGQCG